MAWGVTPRCISCGMRGMKESEGRCFECRERDRERRIMGTVVVLSICAFLLVLGFISAHGEWVRMNG